MRPLILVSALLAGASHAADTPSGDAGFRVEPPHLATTAYVELARHVVDGGALAQVADAMNRQLVMPARLTLRYAECGEANAYYEPETRRVTICFELIEQLAEDFGRSLEDDLELADAVAGAARFIALHEIGHALVDVLELPITGREEDAVDQLSSWLLIREEGGADAVLSAAAAFSIAGEYRELAEGDFADSHSLDQQRYFSMVCWVYGSDPQRRDALLEASGLPTARARGCAAEYARLQRSWSRLLAPHLRE